MKLELGPLPFNIAYEILKYCIAHDIDIAACSKIVEAWNTKSVPDIDWELEIPESLYTYFILRWS